MTSLAVRRFTRWTNRCTRPGASWASKPMSAPPFATEPHHDVVKMSAKKQNWFVEETVAENKVVIFSKTFCHYSTKAKAAMQQFLPADLIKVVEVDVHADGDEILNALEEVTGGRTTPRVFIGGVFIGGGDDTVHKAETGELKKLLEAAGALPKP